jgi:ATP-dependent exoDNAse (exonuclease V) beta subunit
MGNIAVQHIEKEQQSNRLDNLNLLYVTFTRPVQRLYVLAKQGKNDKPNLLRDFLNNAPISINELSKTDSATIYRFGEEFRNPKEKESSENTVVTQTDSVSCDWFQKINVDPTPSMFWMESNDPMQPREWGELVHQIYSEVETMDDIDAALAPYLMKGILDNETAMMLKDKLMQLAKHPVIGEAFSDNAKIKNESDILYHGEIIRPDRYAELPDVIYLLDYKTGKKDEKHKDQIQCYAYALRELTDKGVRAYLVYLSEREIEVDSVGVNVG